MAAAPRRLKRVSWAPEAELRQERLFLSENAPAMSRFGVQDHLQAKASWLWHSTALGSGEPLPSLPKVPHVSKKQKKETFQIPLTKWRCPCRVVLNPQWLVVAGEESREVHVQIQRQLGAFEAIYPRLSSIPANPSESSKAQVSHYDDSDTPRVPLTAIEDEETDSSCSTLPVDSPVLEQPNVPENLSNKQTSPTLLLTVKLPLEQIQENTSPATKSPSIPKQMFEYIPGVEPDIAAAASAAFTAIMKSGDEGSMIDRELLIKILSDPKTIEKLVLDLGASKQVSPPAVSPASSPSLPSQICQSAPLHVSPAALVSTPLPHIADITTTKPVTETSQLKDLNYYKSLIRQHGTGDVTYLKQLIQQHGGEERVTHESSLHFLVDHSHQKDSKPRHPMPCTFFNSPKGCKNGSKCMFWHDIV